MKNENCHGKTREKQFRKILMQQTVMFISFIIIVSRILENTT